MLEIDVTVVPYGEQAEAFQVGKIVLANLTSKRKYFNSYAWAIYEPCPLIGDPYLASGIIRDYYRLAPSFDIILAVLESFKGKNSGIAETDYEKEVIAHLEDVVMYDRK